MRYKQLIFAREFRELSQTELAKSIDGLSQSNLSKFEKGLGMLSENVIIKIINKLNFPKSFFEKTLYNQIEQPHYRKKSSITKTQINKIESKCKLIGYIIDEMSNSIEWPEFKFTPINVEDSFSPEYIANYTRKLLKIPFNEPIKNIYKVLEDNGIIVYELDELEKFDAVSFRTDLGFLVIVINKNFSNDRKRFTLAHELGHIIMHIAENFPIADYRDKENEANRFASEFLMPESEIRNQLFNLKLNDLANLKNYWLTSMSSIVKRASFLNCIDANKTTYFNIELSRKGYRKTEPFEPYIDEPKMFKLAYDLHTKELGYTHEDMSKAFSLPIDIINEVFRFKNVGKLRLLPLS